jgi:uncharacterized membrane protein YoaK (UPF0700 family)
LEQGVQSPPPAFSEEREKVWFALMLTWVAGFADSFGFLALGQIFFSAVSGNTVAVNATLARGDWAEVAHHGLPILCFVAGLFFGAILEGIASRIQVRRRFSLALAFETFLLLCFLVVGWSCPPYEDLPSKTPGAFYIMIAQLSGAMGIQTASLRRVRHGSVNTPFVTGNLVQALENAVNVVFNVYDRLRHQAPSFPADSLSKAAFYGALWFCFAVGAVCGGFGEAYWKFPALIFPIGVLTIIIICDLVCPIYG